MIAAEHVADDCLVLPLDFDCYVACDVIAACDLMLVDDLEQFEHYRSQGRFAGWPEPSCTDGEAERDGAGGRAVAAVNLGVGSVDAVFASHVLERALAEGTGTQLAR